MTMIPDTRNANITHRDGTPWHAAPIPRRLHRCTPQTHGWIRLEQTDRCACGALRFDGHGPWIHRNSRRTGLVAWAIAVLSPK